MKRHSRWQGGGGDDGCAGDKTSCGDNGITVKIDSGGDASYADVGIVGNIGGSRGEDNSAFEVANGRCEGSVGIFRSGIG